MIIVELVDNDTRERRYSDKNVMLRQVETGILYEDAVYFCEDLEQIREALNQF